MGAHSRDEHILELHQRLVEADPLAPSELVETLMVELVKRLSGRVRKTLDDILVQDAVTDALLAYVQEPTKYDPAKSGLVSYLSMSAYGDYLNMVAREQRRVKRQVPIEIVEQRLEAGNYWIEDVEETVLRNLGTLNDEERSQIQMKIIEQFPDPRDRQLLRLLLDGERKTAAYSTVLGIQESDPAEQRRIVKRNKDRLTKRLERLRDKIGDVNENS